VSRVRTLFVTILPAAIAGGFLFASAFGHADAGRESALGFWPAASDAASGAGSVLVAQADPRPAPRYRGAPPAPPVPPVPPIPPPGGFGHGHGRGHGMSVSIHDGKVEIDGIAELVQESLEKALDSLDNLPDVSPDVRDRLKARIKATRDKIRGQLGKLKSMDLDQIGPELERMGDEIEKDMAGLDKDLAQLGDKVGKTFAKKLGKDFAKSFGPGNSHDSEDADDEDDDDDDREAAVLPPGAEPDGDAADLAPAVAALKGLSLDAGQRAQLARLRAESDSQVARARRELDEMSGRLHDTLRDTAASQADVERQIDQISAKEAAIRKARIGAWMKARGVLRKDQRKQVEDAVKNSR
jgi:hypothetical protein